MRKLKDNYWNTGRDYSYEDKKFCFFETEDQKYAIIYDDIAEYSMMQFLSSIEIWKEKEKPELIFKSLQTIFEFQFNKSYYYLGKTDLFALLTRCIPSYEMCYMVLNIHQGLFAKIDCINYDLCEDPNGQIHLQSNYRYFYPQHNNKEEFEKLNGLLISLPDLKWFPLNDLANYCQLPTSKPSSIIN